MKHLRLLGILTILAVNVASLRAEDPNSTRAFSELIRAQAEYQLSAAHAQLYYAQANLENAKAAREYQRVRELNLLVNRLQLTLRKAAKAEYQLERKIERFELYEKRLNLLKTGHNSIYVLQAFKIVIAEAVPAEILSEVMSTPVPAFEPADFINEGASREEKTFRGRTLGNLFNFIQMNQLSLEPFSPAHLEILKGLGRLESFAAERTESLRLQRNELLRREFKPSPQPEGTPGVFPALSPLPLSPK